MMNELAGRLRERVTLLAAQTMADGYGGRAVTWNALVTVAAAVEPEPQNRDDIAGRSGHAVHYRIVLRRRADIVPAMRLMWRGRVLEITAVPPDQPDQPAMILSALEVPGL